jgi:hypothetical protein
VGFSPIPIRAAAWAREQEVEEIHQDALRQEMADWNDDPRWAALKSGHRGSIFGGNPLACG